MSTKRERPMPRFAGAVLCAAASLLLMLCSVRLFADEGFGLGTGLLLLTGLGLLMAAAKSFGPKVRG